MTAFNQSLAHYFDDFFGRRRIGMMLLRREDNRARHTTSSNYQYGNRRSGLFL